MWWKTTLIHWRKTYKKTTTKTTEDGLHAVWWKTVLHNINKCSKERNETSKVVTPYTCYQRHGTSLLAKKSQWFGQREATAVPSVKQWSYFPSLSFWDNRTLIYSWLRYVWPWMSQGQYNYAMWLLWCVIAMSEAVTMPKFDDDFKRFWLAFPNRSANQQPRLDTGVSRSASWEWTSVSNWTSEKAKLP